jgi:hypothetical protein
MPHFISKEEGFCHAEHETMRKRLRFAGALEPTVIISVASIMSTRCIMRSWNTPVCLFRQCLLEFGGGAAACPFAALEAANYDGLCVDFRIEFPRDFWLTHIATVRTLTR